METIIANLNELKRLNDEGRNILIRPPIHPLTGLVLVSGLTKEKVEQMHAEGCEPAVTLESSPGVYQVWVRVGEQLPNPGALKFRVTWLKRMAASRPPVTVTASGGWPASRTGINSRTANPIPRCCVSSLTHPGNPQRGRRNCCGLPESA